MDGETPAKSMGDGNDVVTTYPHYPLSAKELHELNHGKQVFPQHAIDLQNKYPDYFEGVLSKIFPPEAGGKSLLDMLEEQETKLHVLSLLDQIMNGPRPFLNKYESKVANGVDKVIQDPTRENFEWLLETIAAGRFDAWDIKQSLDEVFGEWTPEVSTADKAVFDDSEKDQQKHKVQIVEGTEDDFMDMINKKYKKDDK